MVDIFYMQLSMPLSTAALDMAMLKSVVHIPSGCSLRASSGIITVHHAQILCVGPGMDLSILLSLQPSHQAPKSSFYNL